MQDITIVQQKYTNFINFLIELGFEGHEYVRDLQKCNIVIFLTQVKLRMSGLNIKDEKKMIEASFNEIVKNLNIDIRQYSKEQITKFKLYLEYFYHVSNAML